MALGNAGLRRRGRRELFPAPDPGPRATPPVDRRLFDVDPAPEGRRRIPAAPPGPPPLRPGGSRPRAHRIIPGLPPGILRRPLGRVDEQRRPRPEGLALAAIGGRRPGPGPPRPDP